MYDDLLARVRQHVDSLPDEERGPYRRALATRAVTAVQRGDVIDVTAWLDDGAHHVMTIELGQ